MTFTTARNGTTFSVRGVRMVFSVMCAFGALCACADGTTYLGRAPAAGLCAAPGPATESCSALPALPADPVIDGALECGLVPRALPRETWNGQPPMPDDLWSETAIAWRPDGVYFYVHVRQPFRDPAIGAQQPFCGDSVHLFVDDDDVYPNAPDYGPVGTRGFVVMAPSDDVTSVAQGNIYVYPMDLGPWQSSRMRAFPRADGYVVEAFITKDELGIDPWRLNGSGRVGVNVSVNFGDGVRAEVPGEACPRRGDYWIKGQTMPHPTRSACISVHCNTSAFCNATLEPPARL